MSPPNLCWITTLLFASTNATTLTNPLALIAAASNSASVEAACDVTLTVTADVSTALLALVSCIVNV